ncbi:MAG TPA: hypothetical protein VHS96_17205, partial [Bacteroidia bacterium]|nr:hypothetical protein [Bacteroidia bacterium]
MAGRFASSHLPTKESAVHPSPKTKYRWSLLAFPSQSPTFGLMHRHHLPKAIFLSMFMLIACMRAFAQDDEAPDWQPLLARHFSTEDRQKAATGLDAATYMPEKERLVIAYTNLARLFPLQFDAFYLDWLENVEGGEGWEKYSAGDYFYTTLHKDLQKMKPL